MNVREKLMELLEPHVSGLACEYESGSCELASCRSCNARNIADHLIANGVTVQEWIPVEGRTPGNTGLYLVIEKHWLDGSLGIKIAKWNTVDWFTADRKSKKITPRVTHWMPMPPLPKGE